MKRLMTHLIVSLTNLIPLRELLTTWLMTHLITSLTPHADYSEKPPDDMMTWLMTHFVASLQLMTHNDQC